MVIFQVISPLQHWFEKADSWSKKLWKRIISNTSCDLNIYHRWNGNGTPHSTCCYYCTLGNVNVPTKRKQNPRCSHEKQQTIRHHRTKNLRWNIKVKNYCPTRTVRVWKANGAFSAWPGIENGALLQFGWLFSFGVKPVRSHVPRFRWMASRGDEFVERVSELCQITSSVLDSAPIHAAGGSVCIEVDARLYTHHTAPAWLCIHKPYNLGYSSVNQITRVVRKEFHARVTRETTRKIFSVSCLNKIKLIKGIGRTVTPPPTPDSPYLIFQP